MTTAARTIVYAIDGNDHLLKVGEGWREFAVENDGIATLYPESVIGNSLWDYIKGDSLKQIYRELIGRVRGRDRSIEFEYRCDSPKLKRFMQMQIVGNVTDETVTFFSGTLKVEPQTYILQWSAAHRGDQQLKRCSICNLIQTPNMQWEELETALRDHQLLNCDRDIRLVWGVCELCRRISQMK